jgi:Ca2+-binding EF-hand superfamily protein
MTEPTPIIKSYFQKYDKNSDGSIDAKELAPLSQDLVIDLKFYCSTLLSVS